MCCLGGQLSSAGGGVAGRERVQLLAVAAAHPAAAAAAVIAWRPAEAGTSEPAVEPPGSVSTDPYPWTAAPAAAAAAAAAAADPSAPASLCSANERVPLSQARMAEASQGGLARGVGDGEQAVEVATANRERIDSRLR